MILNQEEFMINDLQMDINPSDVQTFDDNYVFEQSFLRSNAVYCYRSKYSDTKVVLTFPFNLGPLVDGIPLTNNMEQCLKLAVQLNSYPYCFIKNKRVRAYVAPVTGSSTGYMMFAVEELAIVQSAAASNILFLEVTLRYFNHSPLIADFLFVSNQVVIGTQSHIDKEGNAVVYNREYLSEASPVLTTSLSQSDVWKRYMEPKYERVLNRLNAYKLLTAKNPLDLKVYLPTILESRNASPDDVLMEDDGSFVSPDSKTVVVTDTASMDGIEASDQLRQIFNQDFSEVEEEEEDNEMDDEEEVSYADEKLKKVVKVPTKEIFVQYSATTFKQMNLAIDRVEVRRANTLASHRIGSYKHPMIQYLGRKPARTTIHFTSSSAGVYENQDDTSVLTFFNIALQTIDQNRLEQPEAETYNHLIVSSFATLLLGAEHLLPNQQLTSASAQTQGVESLACSLTESNTEVFLEQLHVEASGARSITKIQDDLYAVVLNWFRNFNREVAKDRANWLVSMSRQSQQTIDILKATFAVIPSLLSDLNASSGNDLIASNYLKKNLEENTLNELKSHIVLSRKLSVVKGDLDLNVVVLNDAGHQDFAPILGAPVINRTRIQNDIPTRAMYIREYYEWAATYVQALLELKIARSSTYPTITDNMILNVAHMISDTVSDNMITQKLSNEEKHFLDEFLTTYSGSLFGQNLEDLHLEDLDSSYDESKDVVIQSTDPFFFINYKPIMKNEMIDFFNKNFNDLTLDPSSIIRQDMTQEEAVTSGDSILGLELEKRKLKEVDFDADNFVYNSLEEESGGWGWAGVIANRLFKSSNPASSPDAVIEAIEAALKDYNLSNNEAMREYTYTTAMIESSFGASLSNKSGAQGLFQNTIWPIASLLMQPNSPIMKSLGMSTIKDPEVAKAQAKKIKEAKGFAENYYVSTAIFIEYLAYHRGLQKSAYSGGSYDFAATFSAHNNGQKAQDAVLHYLKTGDSTATGEARSALIRNGGSLYKPEKGWYELYTMRYKDALKTTAEYVKKGRALSKNQPISHTIPNTLARPKANSDSTAVEKQSKSIVDNAYKTLKNSKGSLTLTSMVGQNLKATVVKHRTHGVITIRLKTAGLSQTDYDLDIDGLDFYGTAPYDKGDWVNKGIVLLSELLPISSSLTLNYKGMTNGDRLRGRVINAKSVDVAQKILEGGYSILNTNTTGEKSYTEAVRVAQKGKKGIWSSLTAEQYSQKQVQTNAKVVEIIDSEILAGTKKGQLFNSWKPFNDGGDHKETSEFTYGAKRTDVNTGRPHNGLDFRASSGTQVISAAPGICSVRGPDGNGGGLRVYINHGNGFETRYMHLSKILVKEGQKVSYAQVIGLSGGTGVNGKADAYTPHLHYEVLYKGRYIHPYSTRYTLNEYSQGKSLGNIAPYQHHQANGSGGFLPVGHKFRTDISEEQSIFNEDALATAIINNATSDMNIGLKAAIPALKVYAVYGNENDGLGLDTLKNSAQLYELKGISDFKLVCNSDQTPVDTAIMTVIDPSFSRTDAFGSALTMAPKVDYEKMGTDFELQFKYGRLILKPGTKIMVKLGYGNDPNDLTTVFNGGIMEVSNEPGSNQIMNILLEGYGRELLQEILEPVEPNKQDGDHNSPTTFVIGKSLDSKPIDHFGYVNNYIRWLYKGNNDPEAKNLVPGFFSRNSFAGFNMTKAFLKSRLYMNIFAAELEAVDDEFANYGLTSLFGSIGFSNHQFGYPFYIYRMTPWDCCKQMEYRHPGSIFKPLIFEERMTAFYGVKEQMYFARDLSKHTQHKAAKYIKDNGPMKVNTSPVASENKTVEGRDAAVTYLSRRRERMEPVCNIHMVSSSSNLISNQIRLNSQWSTVTNVSYFVDNKDFNDKYAWESVKMSVDDNLLPWELREKSLMLSGTHGKYVAFLYGITDLKKQAEQMYGGSIVITGNPRVKAGDYVFIDDADNRISGLVLVRDCIHHFGASTGYVTEIIPGQYVEAARFMYSTLWIRLMMTFKYGASVSRLVQSTNFTSEFKMVSDYLSVMNQLEASGDIRDQSDVDAPWLMAGFATAVSFSTFLSWRMASALGLSKTMPFRNLARYSVQSVYNFISNAEVKLARAKYEAFKRKRWYREARITAKKPVYGLKSTMIRSEAFKALKGSRAATWVTNVAKHPIVRLGTTTVLKPASFLLAGVARASLAGLHAFSAVNPIALALDVVLTLAISWFYAKMEQSEMTRQPLLFFPLIKHGRPYVAGMTGAIRNSFLDSLSTEYKKTMRELNKAASLFEGSALSKGEKPLGIVTTVKDFSSTQKSMDSTSYNMADFY